MGQHNQSKIMTISFLSLLMAVSMLSMMLPESGFSESENRYLQKKPKFTIESLLDGSYGNDYESYLSDQFPARNSWIGIKVIAERIQGKRDVNGVYFGKQDYLIEKFDAEDIQGEQLDKNIERLTSFLQGARELLGEDRVRVMMVPSASQILTDRLPYLAAPYDQGKVTEQLLASMRLDGGDTSKLLVPVEGRLKEHSQEDIYYKTDHHWTALGAYYGYRAWAESIGLEPWEQEEFHIKTVSENFLGTLYSKVNVPHKPDFIQLYLPKRSSAYDIYYDMAEVPGEMYTYGALEGKDQYSVYMDGNHGLTEIRNQDKSLDPNRKLMMIKDSFAHSFAPFAVNHFSETYMIDLRYFNQNPGVFMREKGITDLLVLYQIPGFAREKSMNKLK